MRRTTDERQRITATATDPRAPPLPLNPTHPSHHSPPAHPTLARPPRRHLAARLVQGSELPLQALAKEVAGFISDLVSQGSLTIPSDYPALDAAVCAAKIPLLAERKCYGSVPKGVSGREFDDETPEAMFRWETMNIAHLPDDAAAKVSGWGVYILRRLPSTSIGFL